MLDTKINIVTKLHTGCLRNCDSIPGGGKRFISSCQHPDQLWVPPSLPFKKHWGVSFPRVKAAGS
jgi:hypothetical protein